MNTLYTRLIIVIGLANLVPLLWLTPLKDGSELFRADPLFFSAPGLILIGLWGLAYIASAPHWQALGNLMGVFALEKSFYAVHWWLWLGDNGDRLEFLLYEDPLTAFFLGGYGAWDALCAAFFLFLCIKVRGQAAREAAARGFPGDD